MLPTGLVLKSIWSLGGNKMTTELRQHKRSDINRAMVYTAIDKDGTIQARGIGRALDISPKGLMMETREPVMANRLRVRISLPNNESIAIDAELVYSMPHRPQTYRTGIKFIELENSVADAIAGLKDGNS
jgi:hypothetical protein